METTQTLRKKLEDMEREYDLQRKEVLAEIDRDFQGERLSLAENIKGMIADAGHDVEDIARILLGETGKSEPKAKKCLITVVERQYPKYVDPNNPEQTYTRGPLPEWMKKQMANVGMDTGSKADRERFKNEHMMKVE